MTKRAIIAVIIMVCSSCSQGPSSPKDREILKRGVTRIHGDPGTAFEQLCSQIDVPCGEESTRPQLSSAEDKELDFTNTTAINVLNSIVRAKPMYSWSIANGVINIRPKRLSPIDPLDKTVGTVDFVVTNMDSADAVDYAMQIVGVGQSVSGPGGIGQPARPVCAKVSLHLSSPKLLDALNRIAEEDGRITWRFSWSGKESGHITPYYDVISNRGSVPVPKGKIYR